ncbi:MAG: DUF3842 family protein [Anaerolineaceae bacterium]|nr:DUF3842 family protein [Anaerolineaceae bacterium]
MTNIRRWYIFLVNAISLQAVAWAVITLLRNLLVPGLGPGSGFVSFDARAVALQIAIIVIGLPIYLVHWLWAERLAVRDRGERSAELRCLYLYGMMAGFLTPFLTNAFSLLDSVLRPLLGVTRNQFVFPALEPGNAIVYHGLTLMVLALLWFYHWRTEAADAQTIGEPEAASLTVRRLYIYGFSAIGLVMTISGIIALVSWLLFQVGVDTAVSSPAPNHLPKELVRLLLGLVLWLVFWRQAQTAFALDGREQASALRHFYLYLAVFIGVVLVVTNAAGILAGIFDRLLDLPSAGDSHRSLAVIVGTAVLWAYHAAVLYRDTAVIVEQPRQAAVRRLYLYLVAGVGLAALLVGLSGIISVLIRSLAGEGFIADLRHQLADFTAALLVGLPVWLLPWRQAQKAAAEDESGGSERSSQIRKVYLYFYLFVATMTVLTSAVYIVYQLVSLALEARTTLNLFIELGHAIAFTLIAVAVWLYHGSILRRDGRLEAAAEADEVADWRVAVVDGGNGRLGRLLLDQLRQELPQLTWQPVGLTTAAATAMDAGDVAAPTSLLSEADVIIGPWTMTWDGQAGKPEVVMALRQSPARKLLLPVRPEGWEWVGVEPWEQDDLIRQTVQSLKQMLRGQSIEPSRRLNLVAIVIAVIAGLILFGIALSAVSQLFL